MATTIQTGEGSYVAEYLKTPFMRFKKGELWTNWIRVNQPDDIYQYREGFDMHDIELLPPTPITPDNPLWYSTWTVCSLEDMMRYYEWHGALLIVKRTSPGIPSVPWLEAEQASNINRGSVIKFKFTGNINRVGSLGSWTLAAQYGFECGLKFLEKLNVITDSTQEWFQRVLYMYDFNMDYTKCILYSKVLEDHLFPIPKASVSMPVSFDLSQLEPLEFILRKESVCNMVTGERTTTVPYSSSFRIGDSGEEFDIATELANTWIAAHPGQTYTGFAGGNAAFSPTYNNLYGYFRSTGSNLKIKYDYQADATYQDGSITSSKLVNGFI